jgi:hypothetical protein
MFNIGASFSFDETALVLRDNRNKLNHGRKAVKYVSFVLSIRLVCRFLILVTTRETLVLGSRLQSTCYMHTCWTFISMELKLAAARTRNPVHLTYQACTVFFSHNKSVNMKD